MSIRAALFVGFGLIFGLWLVSAYGLARRMGEIEARAQAINARFTQREELLFELRGQVLFSSIHLRDALLDPATEAADYYRDQLHGTRENVRRILQTYKPVHDSVAGRESWALLQRELDEYWNIILPVLAWEPMKKSSEARAFLRREVLPKREVILRISDRVGALNRHAFQQQQAEVHQVYAAMKRRIWATSGMAVLLGLIIAFLVTRYAGALEARIRLQHLRDQENQSKLQRLSARLVHAQEEERRTIARELHDEIGQSLTAIKMDLSTADRSQEPGARRRALEEARAIADRTLQSVRDLSQLLHPAILDDLGLPDTLGWHLRGFTRRTGIRTELVQDGMSARVPAEVEVCAYRIVQEALTNVARHSGASACHVYLQRLPQSLLLTVEDNGKGFDRTQRKDSSLQPGLGLIGIEERVSGLGGTFRLESSPGQGTRLSLELPVVAVAVCARDEATEDEVAPRPAPAE